MRRVSTGRELMRVSDAERQVAAERAARTPCGEGRLDFVEYDDRLARAYRRSPTPTSTSCSPTCPGLREAVVRLPRWPAPSRPAVSRPVPAVRSGFAGLPLALKILWAIWGSASLINLPVWLLVSLGNGELDVLLAHVAGRSGRSRCSARRPS